MGLLADFRQAAIGRHQFPDDGRLSPASIFTLVRDMPFAPTDDEPAAVLDTWRASGWTKHFLLHELYSDFGLNPVLIYAAHEISPATWPWLPTALRSEVLADPLPDVHAFIRLQIGSEWMAIDATWPTAAASLGVPVNGRFEVGRDMKLACDPDELFHVNEDLDARTYYESMIERIVGEQVARRGSFFEALAHWLEERPADPPKP